MYYYHMTSLERLDSINKFGLTPRNEDNSKLISDDKVKVFFSEGFEGTIALYVDFNIVYDDIKRGIKKIENITLNNKVCNSLNVEDYLEEGVYLRFDGTDIEKERNFEKGCTSKVIFPDALEVCILKNILTDTIIYSRFEIIKYMMAQTNYKDIRYYGVKYDNSPIDDVATNKIQEKVRKYYLFHGDSFDKYKSEDYLFDTIPLKEFVIKYL